MKLFGYHLLRDGCWKEVPQGPKRPGHLRILRARFLCWSYLLVLGGWRGECRIAGYEGDGKLCFLAAGRPAGIVTREFFRHLPEEPGKPTVLRLLFEWPWQKKDPLLKSPHGPNVQR